MRSRLDQNRLGIGETVHLMLNYMPRLIQESPDSEPQLRMIRNPPGSCSMIFGGKWTHPFPVYERQADDSLRYQQPAAE